MKLLRTIRLDQSDAFVFAPAAEPGEWAVSGSFVFWNSDPAKLEGKSRTAFRSGFLGIDSLGWSTLVQIVETSDQDRADMVGLLARRLVERFGAPNLEVAAVAAEEEVDFVQSLATQDKGTLVAVHRSYKDDEIRESFRTLRPRNGPSPVRVFSFPDVEGDEAAQPDDEVSLIDMAGRERK
ncbi:MAG TPA: DUF6505 family protein [Pseudolabrys sp.]